MFHAGRPLRLAINTMGILRDIRYNSVLIFQLVSGVMELQAINQVRRHPGRYEGPGDV